VIIGLANINASLLLSGFGTVISIGNFSSGVIVNFLTDLTIVIVTIVVSVKDISASAKAKVTASSGLIQVGIFILGLGIPSRSGGSIS
jgi:hypothetical protein